MCVIELEPVGFWSETERTARKPHTCSICGGAIRPRDRYTVHVSKGEDQGICAAKVCALCQAARTEFNDAHDGEGMVQPPSFVWLLRECISEGDDESETRWKPMLAAIEARHANH